MLVPAFNSLVNKKTEPAASYSTVEYQISKAEPMNGLLHLSSLD